ncbi:MAG: translocation/assembly module TamB [Dysgonamonadaceae bacterium]|jgi:hypothetical protein|nr:translocation/assembly module TamB [Dysgonamonadaceae bacterium]
MGIFKRIVWSILIFVAVFYALPTGLLQIPAVQKKISNAIAAGLTDKFKTEVRIGQIELEFFNKIILKDVFLADRSRNTLLEAKRLAADFDVLPLFRKKWRINSVQLYTFQFNLSKETADSPLNIQYILDVFAGPDSTKNPIDLQIKSIHLSAGSFSFHEKDALETPGKFNPKSFQLNDITSKISIRDFKSDQVLDLIVKRLSFREGNGFRIKQMEFDLKADKEKAIMNQLSLKLENTLLTIKNIEADYSKAPHPENAVFQMRIDNSDVYPKDFSSFVPALSQFEDKVSVDGDFSGTADKLNIQNLCFRYYSHLMLKTNARIKNLFNSNPETIFIDCRIDDSFFSPVAIERIVNNFAKKPFELPETVRSMKSINFQGTIVGNPNNLSANGTLDSETGTLAANVMLVAESGGTVIFKGKITSPKLNLAALTGSNDYGQPVFSVGFDVKQHADKRLEGSIDGRVNQFEYKGHIYNHLTLKGDFTSESFKGFLDMDSPEGKIAAEGLFLLNGADSKLKFTAKATDLQLDKLNLTSKYKNASLSFAVKADLTGDNLDNFIGDVALHDIRFQTDKGSYDMDSLIVTSIPSSENEKTLSIRSEILHGNIRGIYSFRTFVPKIKKTLALYLPSLFDINKKSSAVPENLFSFDITIEDMISRSNVLELPFSFHEQIRITGKYNSIYDKFNLEADIHDVKIGSSGFENMKISLNNSESEAVLNLSGIRLLKNDRSLRFAIRLDAGEDRIKTHLDWGNADEKYRGDLNLTAFFSKEKSFYTQIDVKQSNMVFNDSIWTVYPTKIQTDLTNIKIDHLLAAHNDQFIKIDGVISSIPEEELLVELNKADLEYIFNSLNIKSLDFGGIATGFIDVRDVYKTRKLSTHLNIKNFSFNKAVFGDLDLTGKWDDENQGVLLDGCARKNESSYVDIVGIIYPVKEYLSINFDAKNTDVRFLRKYLNNVTKDITGSLTGSLRLFGNLDYPTVEGNVFMDNFRFGIEFLNTYYTFSDTVRCFHDEIRVDSIRLFDENGQSALVSGYVNHYLFDDFNYSVNASFDNLLILDTRRSHNPLFYGTAYGMGTASLYGTEDLINIDAALQNTGNTSIILNFTEEPDVENYDFIRFIQPRKDTVPKITLKPKINLANANQGTEIRLNLMLDATPQATIEMLMDPTSGDRISAYGNGNIHIQYGTKTPLKVMGNYTIERGKYNFSFQQILYRNFDIQEGSQIAFHGDPYTADLNVKAHYKLTANLGSLHQELVRDQQRVNTTVDCILQLAGQMRRPTISFDIELPYSTPELNRQVKSYLHTEDMMNRQIFYLLVLNTFYTSPEYGATAARNNSDMSLLTSTLSTQLSGILNSFTDKIQLVGTKFHQSNEEGGNSTEMELLLSSQLFNNRLLINGNFGYRDNPYLDGSAQSNNIHWIGDFDIEYKLTPKGNVRLKFFNRDNYRNYYLTPEMTQGLGIFFRKDFNHLLLGD